ncbi:MAG: glycosyltransferase [Proteobacteria bacterium]|nr:glycosyltransferase [Pseudomonadota bacterium]
MAGAGQDVDPDCCCGDATCCHRHPLSAQPGRAVSSNLLIRHRRRNVLRRLGGWDPFNVTEDCDLGIRLYKIGKRTILINSTTWEEANSQLGNWVLQRSRWVKGYFQTHLVHMRKPLQCLRQMGLWGMFGFVMSVGGMSLMPAMTFGRLLGQSLLKWEGAREAAE